MVQLYVRQNKTKIDRPSHELKAFQRVELQPGESRTIHFTLHRDAFSYWNPATREWTADPGDFEIQAGSSSRDIRQKVAVKLPAKFLETGSRE